MHQKQSIGLYIHIPYCVRKCRYCDFLSFQDRYAEEGGRYFQALREELVFLSERYGQGSPYAVRSLFIGGGTPSVAESSEIVGLMETVYSRFMVEEKAEMTIEANPGTVTLEKLRIFYRTGINRLSLGVQSLDDGVLKAMGRIHSTKEAISSYEMARQVGFSDINLDLMLGFPGQSVPAFEHTLRQAIAMGPEHLSAYSLIVEEGTPLCADIDDGRLAEPEQEADRAMYHLACRLLTEAGYERYEISNFARPGYESRHNTGYWTGVPYLGAGLGAASNMEGVRFKNTEDMKTYLESLPDKKRDGAYDEPLTRQDEMDEFMMLGFRLAKGPDAATFAARFGVPYTDVYGPRLDKLLREGLIEQCPTGFCLSEQGLDLGNLVFEEFV